jgi:hypothetical protein
MVRHPVAIDIGVIEVASEVQVINVWDFVLVFTSNARDGGIGPAALISRLLLCCLRYDD